MQITATGSELQTTRLRSGSTRSGGDARVGPEGSASLPPLTHAPTSVGRPHTSVAAKHREASRGDNGLGGDKAPAKKPVARDLPRGIAPRTNAPLPVRTISSQELLMLRGLRSPEDIPAKATKAAPPPTQTLKPLVKSGLDPSRPAPGQRGFDKAVNMASETLQAQARSLETARNRTQERLQPLGGGSSPAKSLPALGSGDASPAATKKASQAPKPTPGHEASLGNRLKAFGESLSKSSPQVLKAFGESTRRSVQSGERIPGMTQSTTGKPSAGVGLDELRARLASPDAARASMPDFIPGPSSRLLGPRTDLLVGGLVPTPSNFEAAKPAPLNPQKPITGPARGPSTQTVPFRPSSGVFVVGKADTPADVAKEAFGRVSG